jgi:hypothetical protein
MESSTELLLHPASMLILSFTVATVGLRVYVLAKSIIKQ